MMEDLETLSQEAVRRSEPWHSSVRTCALSLRSCSSRSRHCAGSWCGSDETLYVPGWITIGIVGAVAGLYVLYLAYRQRITHQGDQRNTERSHSSGLCLQTSATEFFKRHAVFQCVLRSPSRLGSGQVQPPALRVGSGWRTSELQGELLRR